MTGGGFVYHGHPPDGFPVPVRRCAVSPVPFLTRRRPGCEAAARPTPMPGRNAPRDRARAAESPPAIRCGRCAAGGRGRPAGHRAGGRIVGPIVTAPVALPETSARGTGQAFARRPVGSAVPAPAAASDRRRGGGATVGGPHYRAVLPDIRALSVTRSFATSHVVWFDCLSAASPWVGPVPVPMPFFVSGQACGEVDTGVNVACLLRRAWLAMFHAE